MTTHTILNYKKQIIAPFLSSSMILVVALLSLIYVTFHLIKINALDEKIDHMQSDMVLLESLLDKTEAWQRGYVFANNQAFIQRFEQGKTDVNRMLLQIEQQITDYTQQADGTDALVLKLNSTFRQLKQFTHEDLQRLDATFHAYTLTKQESTSNMQLSKAIEDKFDFAKTALTQNKLSIHQEFEHTIKKAMWVFNTLLVVIVGILFSGYRRTIHLFELAVISKNAADEFSHDAYHDALTKLPNRRYFEKHLTSVFLHAKRSQESVALLYLDLDGFKRINDEFGHDAGDEALIYVAQQIKPALRESDFLARLGGDEFAIVVQHESELSDLEGLTRRIIACFDAHFLANANLCKLGVSIGVSSYPANVDSIESLISQADSAMYQAKRTGKNRAVFS